MHRAKPEKPFDCQRSKFPNLYSLWGIAFPLLLTLIDWPFRDILTPSNILLVYLLGVFTIAIRLGLWPSILASLTSAAAFAYFFAPPIFSFAIADSENLVGLAVMLVVGTVTSNLAASVRHQARIAEHREQWISALYRLSKELTEACSEKEIVEIGVRHLNAEFGGRNTLLFPDHNGRLCYPTAPPLETSLQAVDLGIAQQAFNQKQMADNNTGIAPTVYIPLNNSTETIGVLALESVNLRRVSLLEQRQFLGAFINQISHALKRADLAEQAKDATLKMQAETLRNSLLSSISHDLRTPLAAIVCAASTLETDRGHLNEDGKRKLASVISEEAQRMSDLTIKILEMARLEAGEVALLRQWCAPEEVIGSALRRLDKKLKDRQINVSMPDGQTLVYVDAVLLQQVIVNLLDNADKYSPPGLPIDISVETTALGLSIVIADNGLGIPKNMQEKIFDKFFRIHSESAQSGVGLGLSICRAIVEAHGGKIHATERNTGGAAFQLHLPVLEAPPTIDSEEKG